MKVQIMRPDGHLEVHPYYQDSGMIQRAWDSGTLHVGDTIGYSGAICQVIDGADLPYALVATGSMQGMMCQIISEPGDTFS